MSNLKDRNNPNLKIKNYENWPLKIIYSYEGLLYKITLKHINNFYQDNPEIPSERRPDYIHVAGKFLIVKLQPAIQIYHEKEKCYEKINPEDFGGYRVFTENSDLSAIVWVLDDLQEKASASSHIIFRYRDLYNNVIGVNK